ncbi:hypothetical protein POF50_023750 [Streptomyces sp. SL13]|uniref:WD40 repeat domain-containing protein n=1 Tax=Streptantibioticus silvisoli TaxID=2705255 RepID=A0AA90KHU9_9ACTN|nr:hypothetical protein [Streptantibioticus silvisoli]MDI5972315.1 hypothetical protein [Streptantibioticus silvisoli]
MNGPAAAGAPDLTRWPAPEGVTERHGPALAAWAASGSSGGRSRVVLVGGGRGTGKSRLLAWLATGSASHRATTVHALVPAAGLFTDTFAWELARQLGYGPLSPDRLLDQLSADERPLLLVIPDLHLAGRGPADRPAALPRTLAAELLTPLLELPFVRAVVEVGESTLLTGLPNTEHLDLGSVAYGADGGTGAGEEGIDSTRDDAVAGAEALLARIVAGPARPTAWAQVSQAVRAQVLDVAPRVPGGGEAVRRLLADPWFLVHGPAVAVTAWLADERVPVPAGVRAAWQVAAPQLTDATLAPGSRAALLHEAALGVDTGLADRLAPLVADLPQRAVRVRRDLLATALAPLPDAPGRAFAAEPAAGVSILDLSAGERAGYLATPVATTADGLVACAGPAALLLTGDGTLVAAGDKTDATADTMARIAAWHGSAGVAGDRARPTALGQRADGGVLIVGDARGEVHVWETSGGGHEPLSTTLHEAPVTAVSGARDRDGRHTLVVSGALDGTVRLWAAPSAPMAEPVERRRSVVTALCAAADDDGPVLAVAWSDLRLHVWHLPTGRVRAVPLLSRCRALAFSGGRRLVVAGEHGTVTLALDLPRLWG